MISESKGLTFEDSINACLNDRTLSKTSAALKAYEIFKEIVDTYTSEEKTYFTGLHAKLLFIYNKLNVSEDFQNKISQFREFINKLLTTSDLYCSTEDMHSAFRITLKTLQITAGKIDSPELNKFLSQEPILSYEKEKGIIKETFKTVVTNKSKESDKNRIIFCESDENGKAAIYLNKTWQRVWDYVKPYTNLNIIDVEYKTDKKGYKVYFCTKDTFIVYEPDFLIDVTDIASSFQNTGQSEYFYLLKKISVSKPSSAMMIGNIINNIFDEMLSDNEFDKDEIISKEMEKYPLVLFHIKKFDRENSLKIKHKVSEIYDQLTHTIKTIPDGEISIEPSFISPKFGIQGRLDALVESYEEANLKEVIELKSGSYPKKAVTVITGNNIKYSLTTWRNHYIQASCYNLILSEIYPDRYGNSAIFYAKDNERPLRNAPILAGNFQEIVDLRNRIAALEFDLALGDFTHLNKLFKELANFKGGYWQGDIEMSAKIFRQSPSVALEYFKEITAFVNRELFSQKTGSFSDSRGSAYSELWQDAADKKISRNILDNLLFDDEESDIENLHLIFKRIEDKTVNFRTGDQIILYPENEEGGNGVLNDQLLKGVIKHIDSKNVLISLRNKKLKKGYLSKYKKWSIESDLLEHTLKKLPGIFMQFISNENIDIKLGLKEPGVSEVSIPKIDELNETQQDIFNRAISADDYYFVQGPPGTGKTSYLLKNIIKYYYENTDKNILVTAFTNRAVDQICSVLKEKTNVEVIRLGSRESSEHTDLLFSRKTDKQSIDELQSELDSCRVIVSTAASLMSHYELFDLKKFEIGIVDEASQILEPYILSIIHNCRKVIMIGDEKQLPAIVSQAEQFYKIDNERLKEIELTDLSASYFERMIKNAMKRGWDFTYGMLKDQGRMHPEIMKYSGELFYSGKLKALNNIEDIPVNTEVFNGKRVVFYESTPEGSPYINRKEAHKIIDAINELDKEIDIDSNSIGIISPFRLQCALIKDMLPDHLRDLIAVDTVERFQGSERDIIFISFAVNKAHHLENMSSINNIAGELIDRKLNVALTRAKQYLFITGCSEHLKQSPVHSKLLELLENNESVFSL